MIGYEVKKGLVGGSGFLPVENVRAVGEDAIIASDPELVPVKEAGKERG